MPFDTPQDAEDAFYDALESGDADAMGQVWESSAEIACLLPMTPLIRGPEVLEMWRSMFAQGAAFDIQVRHLSWVEGGELALHLIEERIAVPPDPAGRRPDQPVPPVYGSNLFRRGPTAGAWWCTRTPRCHRHLGPRHRVPPAPEIQGAGPAAVSEPPRIRLQSLGCRLNEAELEAWAEGFRRLGLQIAGDGEPADLVVINTCAVTQEAARKSRQMLRRGRRLNPQARLVASGCLVTLELDSLARTAGPDLVVTNPDKDRLVEIAAATLDLPVIPEPIADPPSETLFERGRQRAFVKVQDGCRHRCTFCVTTLARGEERSRPIGEVVEQVNRLADSGIREVVLTGVHLGGYGSDLGTDPPSDLADLIRALLADTAVPRIRLGSLEPWDLPDGFWELFADPRLMPHLHLPMQSGSDGVLRRMGRRCKTAELARLAAAGRLRGPRAQRQHRHHRRLSRRDGVRLGGDPRIRRGRGIPARSTPSPTPRVPAPAPPACLDGWTPPPSSAAAGNSRGSRIGCGARCWRPRSAPGSRCCGSGPPAPRNQGSCSATRRTTCRCVSSPTRVHLPSGKSWEVEILGLTPDGEALGARRAVHR